MLDRQGSHPLGWDRGEGLEVTSSALPRAPSPPPLGLGLTEAQVDELASPFAAFATLEDPLGVDGGEGWGCELVGAGWVDCSVGG